MKLSKILSNVGYDLIESPIRNHKPLQIWIKKPFDEAELCYASIDYAFKSNVVLTEIENTGLSVNASQKDEYNFNIGITQLEKILESLGLGALDISTRIKSGKSVSISYDNSITREYPIGNISEFLSTADFNYANSFLLKNVNNNNLLIITGTVFAKNLVVDIETDFNLDSSLTAKLNELAGGKLEISMSSQSKLKMISSGGNYFPIAVKASRIDFDRGTFKNLDQVTDSRNIF